MFITSVPLFLSFPLSYYFSFLGFSVSPGCDQTFHRSFKKKQTNNKTNKKTPFKNIFWGVKGSERTIAVGMAAPSDWKQGPLHCPLCPSTYLLFFLLRYIHKPSLESEATVSPMKERFVALYSFLSPVSAIHRAEFITSAQWMFIIQIGMHTHLCWVHKWIRKQG